MANDNIFGKVSIMLELPDSGILRDPPDGYPQVNIQKSKFEMIYDILAYGASESGWSIEKVRGIDRTIISLTYEGS